MNREEIVKQLANEIKEGMENKEINSIAEIFIKLLEHVKNDDKYDIERRNELIELAKMVIEYKDSITIENVTPLPKMIENLDLGNSLTNEEIATIVDDLITKESMPLIFDIMQQMLNNGYVSFEIKRDSEYLGIMFDKNDLKYKVFISNVKDGKDEIISNYTTSNFKQALLTVFILSNILIYLVINLGSIEAAIENNYIERLITYILKNLA